MTYSVPHDDARGCIPPTPWVWDTGRHLHLREGCFGLRQTAEKESFGQGFWRLGRRMRGMGGCSARQVQGCPCGPSAVQQRGMGFSGKKKARTRRAFLFLNSISSGYQIRRIRLPTLMGDKSTAISGSYFG